MGQPVGVPSLARCGSGGEVWRGEGMEQPIGGLSLARCGARCEGAGRKQGGPGGLERGTGRRLIRATPTAPVPLSLHTLPSFPPSSTFSVLR